MNVNVTNRASVSKSASASLPNRPLQRARRSLSKAEENSRGSTVFAVCRAIKSWEKMQPELYDMCKTGELVRSEPADVLTLVEDDKAVLIDVRLAPDFTEVRYTSTSTSLSLGFSPKNTRVLVSL